ncbi:uncharacterized protein LY89DRAFT_576156, partial [Mollisia scopiformis]
HDHSSELSHIKIDFTPSSIQKHLQGKDVVICIFSGSDLRLSPVVVDAAISARIKLFIPSEFGLDTSSPKIRELLPPYQTRFEVQEQLRNSSLKWKAIYSGIMLEDGLKTGGVLGIDVMWGSVVVFPGAASLKVALSTYEDVASEIISALTAKDAADTTGRYTSTFTATLDDLIQIVEKQLDRKLDRYEGNIEGARKEAAERMKMGYFDGGVALMGRIAVWGPETGAWEKWAKNENPQDWQQTVGKMAQLVRDGDIGGDGCGC